MGMPDISITFSKLAESAKGRSAKDIVCIITKDNLVNGLYTYSRDEQVSNDKYGDTVFSRLLKEGFTKYGVYKVIVYSLKADETIDAALAVIKKLNYQWLAFNFKLSEEEQTKIKEFKDLRLKNHAPIQVIATDYAAEDKFISNFIGTGIKVNDVAMEDYQFSLKIAFIHATLSVTKSATFYVLDDVTAVDEIEDEDKAVNDGKIFITFDGEKYKLSRAVNSLTHINSTTEKASMKKTKVVSGMCLMHNDIFKTFRDEYCGQCENEYADRLRFIAAIKTYIKKLEGTVLKKGATNEVNLDATAMRKYMEASEDSDGNPKVSVDTTEMTDDVVLQDVEGYCETKVFASGVVRFADAMEDLDLKMYY